MSKWNIIVRSLARQRLNTSVIIVSLAMGIACVNLAFMFIYRELKTDSFQTKKDRIYALQVEDPFTKGKKINYSLQGSVEYMKENFSQIEDFCRFSDITLSKMRIGGETFTQPETGISASTCFFDIFTYPLLAKARTHVLGTAQDIVISEDFSKKYFGNNSPLGQVIVVTERETLISKGEEKQYVVSGVFQKPKENSQFRFEWVILTERQEGLCYLLLKEGTNPKQVEDLLVTHKDNIISLSGAYSLQPFTETYFNNSSQNKGNRRDVTDLWIALMIGLMILFVAAFNYLSLLTYSLTEKQKEYKIRRINGGSQRSLITGFMQESLIVTGTAFLLSLLLTGWATPFYSSFIGATLTPSYVFQIHTIGLLSGIVIFLLLITLIFCHGKILQEKKPQKSRAHFPAFTIFQVAVSIILIICSSVIIRQVLYITHKEIGLNKEVMEIKVPEPYFDKVFALKEELKNIPSIERISLTQASPVSTSDQIKMVLEYEENGKKTTKGIAMFKGDENYIQTLGIQLIEGTNFQNNPQANKKKILINESLAKQFPGRAVIGGFIPGFEGYEIIGIVKDFHYSSLKEMIEPAYIHYSETGHHLLIQSVPGQNLQTRKAIETAWTTVIKEYPPVIESVGDQYEVQHLENKNYAKLMGAFCLISVLLSMMGLFALSFHSIHRRTKEIGIRKVNGAKIGEILTLLNQNLVQWIFIAFILAIPVAWYTMHQWLQNFAYKTTLSWWIFAGSGLLAMGIALLTVSGQCWRAATRNPAEVLKYE